MIKVPSLDHDGNRTHNHSESFGTGRPGETDFTWNLSTISRAEAVWQNALGQVAHRGLKGTRYLYDTDITSSLIRALNYKFQPF